MRFKDAMKDILLLLVLLNAVTIKVCSLPYEADSDGNCRNSKTEYWMDALNLCCKKCSPGQRVKDVCSETTDTVCEPCPEGQFIEGVNYSPNCFSCIPCKPAKNLQVIRNCSSTTRNKCGCKPGTYCILGFNDPYCQDCAKYSQCKAGYGVSVPGTANSDVKCERCSRGTFSDKDSSMDRCRPHTICDKTAVVRQGDATSDTECELEAITSNLQPKNLTGESHTKIMATTAATTMTTVSATSDSKTSHEPAGPAESINPSVMATEFNPPTKGPPLVAAATLVTVFAILTAVVVLVITIILLFFCKTVRKKDPTRYHPKVDANGNCETGDKGYLEETKLTSFKEQQCLLEKVEACSEQSQSSSNTTETLTRTDGCNSFESIGPLQSTLALHNPQSAISAPMTLLSNTESVNPQTSIPTQSSSQPTSPQIISPETTSPQVNVNIIFSIGNGSGGTQSVIPKDLIQVDSKLPFGEEEESINVPQQEDGKYSQMSVQESASYSV